MPMISPSSKPSADVTGMHDVPEVNFSLWLVETGMNIEVAALEEALMLSSDGLSRRNPPGFMEVPSGRTAAVTGAHPLRVTSILYPETSISSSAGLYSSMNWPPVSPISLTFILETHLTASLADSEPFFQVTSAVRNPVEIPDAVTLKAAEAFSPGATALSAW